MQVTFSRFFKHYCYSIILVFIYLSSALEAKIFIPKEVAYTQKENKIVFEQPNTIKDCYFDIHDVLVERETGSMVKMGIFNWSAGLALYNKQVRRQIQHMKMKDKAPEDMSSSSVRAALDILNARRPIKDMIPLLQTLKSKGYALHILSNIGEAMYYGWQNPYKNYTVTGLKAKLPHLFSLFTKEHVDARKPSPTAFAQIQEQIDPHTIPVFIDDLQENIDTAVKYGFIGIRFESPEQLKQDLTILGLL